MPVLDALIEALNVGVDGPLGEHVCVVVRLDERLDDACWDFEKLGLLVEVRVPVGVAIEVAEIDEVTFELGVTVGEEEGVIEGVRS